MRTERKAKPLLILENIQIISTGDKGVGVGRTLDNIVVFVKGAIPLDVVDVKVTKKKSSFFEGEVWEIKSQSPNRVTPFCKHFNHCGGCTWQNLSYKEQLNNKQDYVKGLFKHIGKLTQLPDFEPILASQRTEFYRNRLDYAFSENQYILPENFVKGENIPKVGLGFHVSGKFDKILDIDYCFLQEEPSNTIRNAIKHFAIQNEYPFFNPKTNEGFIRNLIIKNTSLGNLMVLVAFKYDDKEKIHALCTFLLDRFPSITSLYYVINPKVNDFLLDLEHHLFFGEPYLIETINEVKYLIGPKSFFQTNILQTKELFNAIIGFTTIKPTDVVLDLYCGVGSISLQLAKKAKKVIGIEYVDEAIEFAKLNAKENGLNNTSFFAGDAKELLKAQIVKEPIDLVVTDPPRNGMDKDVVFSLLELNPKQIIYVSCNPATQARDLELMKEHYDVKKIMPVDMFPHTYHVENIVLLQSKSKL